MFPFIDDPRFSTNPRRVQNVEELDRIVGAWVGERSEAEVIELLLEAGVAGALSPVQRRPCLQKCLGPRKSDR